MTTPSLEQIHTHSRATQSVLSAWDKLPALYEAGPLFVITERGENRTLLANELLRRLAIEQSVREANDYWCCAQRKLENQLFARPNEWVLDSLDRYDASPSLPFLWVEFPDARTARSDTDVLQAICKTVRTFRKRGVGRFEEERERWQKIGRKVGDALSVSTFDAVVEAWSPSIVGDETAKQIKKAGVISDSVETTVEFAEGLSGDANQGTVEIPRRAAALARECLEVARASFYGAAPKSCASSEPQRLFEERMVPVAIAVENVEWQGIGCLEFLRAIIAACAEAPWPVLVVAAADNLAAAKQILCTNIHAGTATLTRASARVFEAPSAIEPDRASPNTEAASSRLADAIERAQAFCLERQQALEVGDQELADATADAIRLRNEIACCAQDESHPRLADMAFALLGMALAGAVAPARPHWESLVILEAAGPELEPFLKAAFDRSWPPQLVNMVTEIELLRLQDLSALYGQILDFEGLRALCSEDGPLFTLCRVYQRYGLDELPLFELFEDYLFEVSKFRPAALPSGELRAKPLLERVLGAHPELSKAMAVRQAIRNGQAQLHLKKYKEALDTLARAAANNRTSGAAKSEADMTAARIARIIAQAKKRLESAQRELDGGGMLRETFQLIGRVWSGQSFTP